MPPPPPGINKYQAPPGHIMPPIPPGAQPPNNNSKPAYPENTRVGAGIEKQENVSVEKP